MIYLDNNATTQLWPEVVEAMQPFLHEQYANPSSLHRFGQEVRHRMECAREQVANLLHASPKEIVFTSGGTESINLAIRGAVAAAPVLAAPAAEQPGKRRLVTTAVEHSAVLRVMEQLEHEGYAVDYVGVDREGRLNESEWAAKLTDDVALASVMLANNETGVVFDARRLCEIAAARGVPVHVDAVQAAGKLEIDLNVLPATYLSLSAHKFHGPKGAGALYVRRRARLQALIRGGGQERELRGGTENVAGIVGLGVAAEAAARHWPDLPRAVGALRDRLESGIREGWESAVVNGGGCPRVANTTNISFPGLEAEAILIVLSEAGICASSGSACSSGSLEPSHVLQAMGAPEAIAHGAIRFSLSPMTTRDEIEEVIERIPRLLRPLEALVGR